MKDSTYSQSMKEIRKRLVIILVRAFLVVAIVGVVALLAFTFFQISRQTSRNPFYRDPNATILEAYYLGHGSWEGIETIVDPRLNPESKFLQMDWERSVLLDANGQIIMYYGKHLMMDHQAPTLPTKIERLPLRANGEVIGFLISEKRRISQPVRLSLGVMNPIFMVAGLLILLTVIIGVLLMRRVVNPLAEVIAAAERVSSGDLKTRIKLSKSKDDLNTLAMRFNHMTETLERNDNERRGMLADIAHELRTPLSILRGRLEGMIDGIYPLEQKSITQVLDETQLLERLVDDLRLLTLAETRQLHFESKEVDLVKLLGNIVTSFESQSRSKNVSLTFINKDSIAISLVDPQRFEQVIGNLIENSLRYIPEGSKIEVSEEKHGNQILVKIADNGPGIKEGDLPYIFDRFWRAEKSRARTSGGAGLGLAISKQLTEAQGGKISAQNGDPGGLEITITLPEFQTS